jgi:hypothetical protein
MPWIEPVVVGSLLSDHIIMLGVSDLSRPTTPVQLEEGDGKLLVHRQLINHIEV